MVEIIFLIDKGNNDAELAKMNLDKLQKHRERNMIIFNGNKYRVLEANRVPATEGGYNDTFFTYVYVELAPERRSAL